MQVKNIFRTTTFGFCIAILILIILIIIFSINIKRELELVNSLSEIDKRCTENTLLVSELRAFPSQRLMDQFFNVSKTIALSFNEFSKESNEVTKKTIIDDLHKKAEDMTVISELLLDYLNENNYSVSLTRDEKFFLYTSQLLVNTSEIDQGVYQIITDSTELLIQQFMMMRIVIIGILLIFLFFTFYHLRLINFRILEPLKLLGRAIKQIKSGDFEYRIMYDHNDEMGLMAKVFNEMSVKLSESTVSKTQLEKELIKRQKIEEELNREKTKAMELLKVSESANNAKNVFLANMSHEMRTPLTGIIGSLELFENQDLDEDSRFLLGLTKTSAQQMNHIVDNLLEITKISMDKYELHYDDFNLLECFKHTKDLFLVSIKQKGLNYEFKKGNIPKKVNSDKSRIMKILDELISNAIKFTSEGLIKLSFEFIRKNEQFGELLITVSDTGIGIERTVKEHIYDFFYQKDMSFTKDYQGMGIGLTIVKNIVNKMDGQLDLKTQEGEGTTFKITLPMQYSDEEEFSGIEKVQQDQEELLSLNKILMVEDNRINRVVLRKMLETNGYSVVEAVNGREAIEKMREYPDFDLILMDIQMPIMNGYDARKEIVASFGADAPDMIALTGYSSDLDIRKINEAGFEGYLSKPYSEYQLLEIIKKFDSPKDKVTST